MSNGEPKQDKIDRPNKDASAPASGSERGKQAPPASGARRESDEPERDDETVPGGAAEQRPPADS